MFGSNHYVPILKAKDGEFAALRGLNSSVKSSITPVLEVTMPTEKKTWEQHFDTLAKRTFESVGSVPVFVDARWIDGAPHINSTHPLEYLFNQLRAQGCKAIPVTGIHRDQVFQQAVSSIVSIDNYGVAIRLEGNAFANLSGTETAIQSLLNSMRISISDLDLIVDFRSVSSDHFSYLIPAIKTVISTLPSAINSRTLVFAASGFPINLSEIRSNSIDDLERTEWLLWSDLYSNRTSIARLPAFGDYTIAHPDLPVPILFPNRSAQIRYALSDRWQIYKGYGVLTPGKGGSSQSVTLCQSLIASGNFYGRTFSEGDAYIEDCANLRVGTGNGTTWRKVGTSHHINVVSNQLSSLAWP